MTRRIFFALAASTLAAVIVETRAQEAPHPPREVPAAVAAPAAPAPPRQVLIAPAAPVAAVAPLGPVTAAPATAPSALAAPAVASAPLMALAEAPLPPPQGVTVFHFGDNFLGVSAEEITHENMGRYGLSGEPRGVGVREVVKDSPAERAGLRAGDVILRFDGEPVTSLRKLNRLIDESAPEHQARLTVRRGGSEQEITVKLGKREMGGLLNEGGWGKQSEEWRRYGDQVRKQGEELRKQMETWRRDNPNLFSVISGGGRRIGVTTNALGKQLADYFGVTHGVLITSVGDDSPAARADLKAGDIVTEVEGEKIDEAGDLSRALNRKDEGEVTLTVVRDRNRRTVRVTPEKGRGPGGTWELRPGTLIIDPPTVAVTAPSVRIDLPRITITPKVKPTTRVKAATPARIL